LRITGVEAVGVVEDDGRGLDTGEARQEGTGGLDFMAEGTALVGGTCRVGSSALVACGSRWSYRYDLGFSPVRNREGCRLYFHALR
jgi:glucose-6-phosphate-specific signal transduction histidine kinase